MSKSAIAAVILAAMPIAVIADVAASASAATPAIHAKTTNYHSIQSYAGSSYLA